MAVFYGQSWDLISNIHQLMQTCSRTSVFCDAVVLVGIKISEINRAEGERQAAILASEAEREAQINRANGEANAILAKAKARAESLQVLSAAIGQKVRLPYSEICDVIDTVLGLKFVVHAVFNSCLACKKYSVWCWYSE